MRNHWDCFTFENRFIVLYRIMNREIILSVKRNEMEKLFLSKSEGNYFTSEILIEPFRYSVICIIILIGVISLDQFFKIPTFCYIVIVPVTAYFVYQYYFMVKGLYNHKKSIKDWLDYVESFTNFKVNMSENSIALTMDEQVTIQKWSSITYCKMDDKRITLKGESQVFLPAVSMTGDEFQFLKEIITRKLGEGGEDIL